MNAILPPRLTMTEIVMKKDRETNYQMKMMVKVCEALLRSNVDKSIDNKTIKFAKQFLEINESLFNN